MKIYTIQYLRAIAAMAVLLAHALLEPIAETPQDYVRFGTFGVLLFFVISGFIMVYITKGGVFDPLGFVKQRIERIVPLYWLATFLIALVAVFAPMLLKQTSFSLKSLLLSLLFIPYPRTNGEIVPLMKLGWTLNYEVFFYLLFALHSKLNAVARVGCVTVILLTFCIVGNYVDQTNSIFYFYTRPLVLSFAVGMWVGIIALYAGNFIKYCWTTWLFAALSTAFMLAGFLVQRGDLPNPLNDALFALAGASLVLFGLSSEAWIPRWKWAIGMGDASYAIYITHIYVVVAVTLLARRFFQEVQPAVLTSVTVGLAILVSIVVHRFVERPIQRWFGRRDARSLKISSEIPNAARSRRSLE